MMKRYAETNVSSFSQNNFKRKAVDSENRQQNPVTLFVFSDLQHLGVKQFLGHTRVHVRRYVVNEDNEYQPTKDGVSLSPKTWHSLCSELESIFRHKSAEKLIVI